MTTLTEQAVRAAMEGCEGVTKGPWTLDFDHAIHDVDLKNGVGWFLSIDSGLGQSDERESHDEFAATVEHLRRCSPEFIRALCEDWLRQREALEKVDRIAKVPFGTFNHISQVASAALSPLPEEKKPS